MIADLSGLHDGRLVGLQFGLDKSALLVCRKADGEERKFSLLNVERLKADSVREGNIIFELTIYHGVNPPADAVKRLFDISDEGMPFVERAIERVRNGELVLVHLIPSYGCELIAICGNIMEQ
jgi:hypothetical protein